jgi:glycosyltransferase involved in cell wall biosynthesis
MLLWLSDFDLIGSGYMQISIALCKALGERGRKVMALGLGYNGSEHNWPFSIIPIGHDTGLTVAAAMIQNLSNLAQAGQVERIEGIVVALDIPLQQRMRMVVKQHAPDWPYIGIFPIESGPLCPAWAAILSEMTERLVISQFGLQQMKDAGVDGHFIPIGLDTASWRPPEGHEKEALRSAMGFEKDHFVILTVADNQERKNLWAAAETIKRLVDKGINAQWVLVTRMHSPVGWQLEDLGWKLGIQEHMMPFDRGLSFDKLWTLYAVADAFLLTSKAEGFGMPMIEAEACGVPVVATDCTAIPEQIFDDYPGRSVPRGFPISVEYWNLDPWGNSMRAWANADSAAEQLARIHEMRQPDALRQGVHPDLQDIIDRGIAYARSRTWEKAVGVLEDAVRRAAPAPASEPEGQAPPLPANITPLTVPSPVPVLGRTTDVSQES